MFNHKFAESAHYRHGLFVSGIGDGTLVVTANIPLREESPGYDAAKIEELVEAAVSFAKTAQVSIEFLSVL